jgi:hypothetical protein
MYVLVRKGDSGSVRLPWEFRRGVERVAECPRFWMRSLKSLTLFLRVRMG